MILEIIINIAFAYSFYNIAKENGLTAWVWPIVSIAMYFAMQFVAGILIGMIAPDLIYSNITIIVVSYIAGFTGLGITYLILRSQMNAKKQKVEESDLLDENI